MNMKFIPLLLLSPVVVLLISSCKKDLPQNNAPVANAGTDITIILPTDNAELNGSGTDMDGDEISFYWYQLSGPSSSTIVNLGAGVTKVENLVEGTYEFVLEVGDGRRWVRDSVAVFVVLKTTVPGINCQMTSVGMLSKPRYYLAAASTGNKILFAGGDNEAEAVLSRVDIYDISSQTWSVAELSEARTLIGAATVGNKVLFSGGATFFEYGWDCCNSSSRGVDIYDVSTNTWTTNELPEARNFFNCERNGAVIGNKVFFAGRFNKFVTSDVQVYDVSANSWSSFAISEPRVYHAMVSVGDKILVAGGITFWGSSKSVEVYDASGNLLSVDSLSEAGGGFKAATLNNKAFFAGGGSFDRVDIYDGITQTWSIASLSRDAGIQAVVSAGQRIFFFGDKRVNIYDDSTGTWSIADLPASFSDGSAIIAAGGNIYATNGDQVWQVEF